MYRQWHYAMRSHDMADAAIFGKLCAAPKVYFGYIKSKSLPTTLTDIQEDYNLGTPLAPQAGATSVVTATIHLKPHA